jgi:hypothetical protein
MTAAKRRLAAVAAVIGVLAIGGWRIFSAAVPSEAAGAIGDAWDLPGRNDIAGDKLLEGLLSVDPWGLGSGVYKRAAAGVVGEPAAAAPRRWSIKGMLQEGSSRFVLVSIDDKPAEPLGVGQTLPSGEKILQIEPDRLCILINGTRRSLEIRSR